MGKRFTDTEKYSKPWFRKLKPKYKCFWDYITSKCDLAGVWEKDFEAASFHVGEELSEEDIINVFGDRLHFFDDKILVVDFVSFQYGDTLNPKSPVHKKIIDRLNKYTLFDRVLNRVSNTPEEEEEEEEKEKEEEIGIEYPWGSDEFSYAWSQWKTYKKEQHNFKYKSRKSEQAALTKLNSLTTDELEAIKIIHESIAQGWKGFFEIRKNGSSQKGFTKYAAEQLAANDPDFKNY